MANFSDILKGVGKYVTTPGRDLAQMLKLTTMASRVKRVRPEDFDSADEYRRALAQSNEAFAQLQREQVEPTANLRLNEILGVTPKEQERQQASELLTPLTGVKDVAIGTSMVLPGAKSLLGAMGLGGVGASMGAAGYAPQGEEAEAALSAFIPGALTAGAGYGIAKLGQGITGKIKASKPASDQATRNLGLDKKAINDLGGWSKAREFAGEFYDDSKTFGLDSSNRYSRAEALATITDTLSSNVDEILMNSRGVANSNEIVGMLDSDPILGVLKASDDEIYNGILELIMDSTDEAGNISPVQLKSIIEQVQKVAGGFGRTVGDQSARTSQILTQVREVLRDTLQSVAPEAGDLLSKWSKYIKVSPSVGAGNVAKAGGLLNAPMVGRVGGTGGAKVSDFISNLVAPKGSPSRVSDPSVLRETIGAIGGGIQSLAPVVGGFRGAINPTQQTQPESIELGDDDEGLMAIREAFRTPSSGAQSSVDSNQQVKQILAMGVLSGEIGAGDAETIISLLGLDSAPSGRTLPAGNLKSLSDTKEALNLLPKLTGLVEGGSSAFGPVEGQIRSRIPWDKTGQKAKSTVTLVKQIIGKGLEGGVLRKEDEYKYEQILPKLGDTEDTVRTKIQLLEETLRNKYDTAIEMYQAGGYDPYAGIGDQDSALYEMLGLQ